MSWRSAVSTVILAGLGALMLSSCSHMSEIGSSWNGAKPVTVDGSADEWSGSLWDIADAGISFGAKNDGEYLYLCLITTDRSRMFQILGGGMTWWINGKGGKEKSFGLRFPVGGLNRSALADLRDEQVDEVAKLPSLDEAQREFEVVRGSSRQRISVAECEGVLARIGREGARFVCELRVPLGSNHPYAIGAEQAVNLAVGLETEKMEPRPEGQRSGVGSGGEGEGGGERGGMRGGRGGGGRGGMRGGGGGRSSGGRTPAGQAGPLDVWLKVALAPSPH